MCSNCDSNFRLCFRLQIVCVLVVGLIGAVLADKDATVLRHDAEVNVDGSYQYAYETSNGIAHEEQGALKNLGEEQAQVGAALWRKCLIK